MAKKVATSKSGTVQIQKSSMFKNPFVLVVIVGVLAIAGLYLLTSSNAAPAQNIGPYTTQWPGVLTLHEGAGPFVREQTLNFDVTYSKSPQNKAPWVEVVCVEAGGKLVIPGFSGGSVPLWVGRDYDAPYSVLLGDAGGTSRWQLAGYPAVDCQAFLYRYYEQKGYQLAAYFDQTPVFRVNPPQ